MRVADLTPEQREVFLTCVMEDARAALVMRVEGATPVCAGCGRGIPAAARFMYRCTDCTLPFHRRCAYEHFAKHGDANAVLKLTEGATS